MENIITIVGLTVMTILLAIVGMATVRAGHLTQDILGGIRTTDSGPKFYLGNTRNIWVEKIRLTGKAYADFDAEVYWESTSDLEWLDVLAIEIATYHHQFLRKEKIRVKKGGELPFPAPEGAL